MTFKSELLERLQSDYRHAGNKVDAIAMQAYQKNISLFLGIRTPERRTINKAIFRTISTPTTAELGATARALWKDISGLKHSQRVCKRLTGSQQVNNEGQTTA